MPTEKHSTTQSIVKSSRKEKSNAKTFRIPISNGIFEHYKRLKDARWLLDWYIDKTTKEVPAAHGSRDGIVLGGKPIRDEDPASAFGCCTRTTRTWRMRLTRFGYIEQLRTPVGYVIRVKKSKKWLGDRKEIVDHSIDVTGRELPIRPEESFRPDRKDSSDPIKTVHRQDRDEAEEATAAAFRVREKSKTKRDPEAWKAVGMERCGVLRFTSAWETIFGDSLTDEKASDTMECCIQYCQQNGITVPRPFYEAKRRVEQQEAEDDSEVSRVAGPRGVAPELMR